jgi:hypothetical protein
LPTNYFKTSTVLIGEWFRVAAAAKNSIPKPCAVGEDRALHAQKGVTSENRFHLQAEFRQETS